MGRNLPPFCIEDQAESSRTPPLTLQIALMDKNMKKEDVYIGAVTTRLQVGLGKTRVEIKSELPSSRPSDPPILIYFRYEATPRMFYDYAEWDAGVPAEPKDV